MHIIVLGSAAGGGSPQWNCNCSICQQVRQNPERYPSRTQASIAVSGNGQQWVIIDCAPEVLQQIQASPPLYPKQLRHSPISSVIVTSADIDHIAGLLSLRESSPFKLYATEQVHSILNANSVFNVLNRQLVTREKLTLNTPIKVDTELSVTAFSVPGKTALYLPDEDKNIGEEGEVTIGIELVQGNKRAYYISGCANITDSLLARLEGADLLFFDGTLWSDDELIREGLINKSGQRMGHISVAGDTGSMAKLANTAIKQKYFIHINNSNPILLHDSDEHREVIDAGWRVAVDGLEIII